MRGSVNTTKYIPFAFLLLFSSVPTHAQNRIQFLQAFGFNAPGEMVSADFNSDGKLDIAWASNNGGALLLGNGDGTFKMAAALSVTGAALATADFNADGKADLVIANQSSSTSFSVLLGNGDGTFQPALNTNPGTTFTSASAVDVNGDGKADVLGQAGSTLFVLLGNGDGTFKPGVMYAIGSNASPFMTGDFNGDGKLDVAAFITTGANAEALAVLLGNGDGTFKPPLISSSASIPPSTLGLGSDTVADANGDGKLDVLVDDLSTSEVLTFLGNGDGTFRVPISGASVSSLVSPPWTDAVIAVADLNQDGKPDLAVATAAFLEIFQGNGDGTFSHTRDYGLNFGAVANNGAAAKGVRRSVMKSVTSTHLGALNLTGSSTNVGSGILIADFNNDAKLDIAAVGSLFLGNGDGTFQAAPAVPTTGVTFQAAPAVPTAGVGPAATGDFNNDGKTDVAMVAANGIEIFLGDGTDALNLAHNYTANVRSSIATADVNGDGKMDLVFSTFTGSAWTLNVMLGNGDGSFGPPIPSSGGPAVEGVFAPIIGDFNGDHKPDVAVVDQNGLAVCLGHGDGTFASPITSFAGASPDAFVVADFNNDGRLDAAVSSSAGVAILLGKGDGTFQPAVFTSLPVPQLAADVNGDGNIDLLSFTGQHLEVSLGNGDGSFKVLPPQSVTLQGNSSGVSAAADFNGDGKVDLAVATQPEIAVVLGNGDGTFGPANPIDLGISCCPPGAGPFSFVGVADFNGDKRPDLLVTIDEPKSFPSYGGVFVLLDTTPSAAGKIQLAVAAGSSSSATVSAGSTAKYDLTISGINGTASLTCTGAPAGATCSVPATVSVSATSVSPFTVSVATSSRSTAMLRRANTTFPPRWWWAIAIVGVTWLPLSRSRRRVVSPLTGTLSVLLLLLLCSCGGGTNNPGNPNPTGTPPGTYALTVTATSGAMTGSMTLTLVVQ
jgi:hypothetical protein